MNRELFSAQIVPNASCSARSINFLTTFSFWHKVSTRREFESLYDYLSVLAPEFTLKHNLRKVVPVPLRHLKLEETSVECRESNVCVLEKAFYGKSHNLHLL